MPRSPRSLVIPALVFAVLGTSLCLCAASPAWAEKGEGLPDYFGESSWLLSPPGMSTSLAAGLWSPAAYSMAQRSGLYLGWRGNDQLSLRRGDLDRLTRSEDFAGIVSLHHLSFSYQRFDYEPDALEGLAGPGTDPATTDYGLNLSGGNRDGAVGLSYSWAGGDRDLMPRHRRLGLGMIGRRPFSSLGLTGWWDLENGDTTGQLDLGVRPLGPRLTFFADLAATQGRRAEAGWGVEANLFAGLRAGLRYRDAGRWGLGVALAFGGGTKLSVIGSGNSREESQNAVSLEWGGHRETHIGAGRRGANGGGVAELSLKGPMPYRTFRYFDERRPFLPTLVRMAAWSEAPSLKGVLLDLSGMRISREMLWELREQAAGLRAAGKRITVYADRLGLYEYVLASEADELWLDPQGHIEMRGLRWGRTYYRAALDKLGLGVDEWRYFTYKSAFEVLSRTEQSEADREQRQELVDDFYETVRALVCERREISETEFDRIVDELGHVEAQRALELGLADRIGSLEDARNSAKEHDYDPDFAATGPELTGVLGDPLWAGQEWGEPDRIAVLYAIGPCAMDSGIEGPRLAEAIRRASEDPYVKAIVLRADSPGGDPLPSDLVARALKEAMEKKPVVISQGNVAASGGYWISMNSDAILASPLTLTGSIGVIGGWIYDDGFGEKIGFDYSEVHRGEHADLGGGIGLPFAVSLPARPLDGEEKARVETLIRDMYAQFVAAVAEGRGMSEEQVDAVGQGRVWSGSAGVGKGLVDELGGLWSAIQRAKREAGIPEERAVHIVQGPELGSFDFGLFRQQFGPDLGLTELDPLGGGKLHPLGPWMGLSEEELRYLRDVFGNPGRPMLTTPPMEILDGSGRR